MYNLCTMFGFDRKEILKQVHRLIDYGYGSFNELITLTIQEITDICKVIMSIQQEETLKEVGL